MIHRIRYQLTIPKPYQVYGFGNPITQDCTPPPSPGMYAFQILANTLLCKTETKKLEVQEFTLSYQATRDLVQLFEEVVTPPMTGFVPKMGALFAEHIMTLKGKSFFRNGKEEGEHLESFESNLYLLKHLAGNFGCDRE